ncbi:DNA binding domain-containing protein, excisionase family [Georgenia satyanarayanai]|uniref:DNA binding domain-containing protein, excisionase family n=1 Tax=Georgenia satyanarayanai TaxID=860221 RepID=A0A2Y9AE88_9MICO|nr:helix-turn-helix domain-containing protein [Georgenia satyanarayanai]PYG00268.1 excisionase family DNA binding protein [Georgenia satyanarayanai]SSA40637.1 DNA binding domain-containing protein, excisionase family [Georgenia satyanarayanai]
MGISATRLGGLEPLLDVQDLAEYLGVPIRMIYDWRQTGHGPRGFRVGRHLKFAVSDVAAWVEARRNATADRRDRSAG